MKQLTLGELIEKLEKIVKVDGYDSPSVYFDFARFYPTYCNSYRGYYEQIAIGYADGNEGLAPSVVTFMNYLQREVLGEIFTGYKGGEYMMHSDTPVWVASYGHAEPTAVVDVSYEGYLVIIHTAYKD